MEMTLLQYLLVSFAVFGSSTGAVTCGENERAVSCGQPLSCQPSCVDPDRVPCAVFACIRGCECVAGYTRATNNAKDNPCIKTTQCTAARNSTCGVNEVESDCANPCQPFCEEPKRSPCPTLTCSQGCVCAEGHIRATEDASSACISTARCP